MRFFRRTYLWITLLSASLNVGFAATPQLEAREWPGVEGVGYAARRVAVVVGKPFNYALRLSFPDPAATVTALDPLPPGLRFDPSTYTLSGTPTQAGEFAFGFVATNAAGQSTLRLNLVVEPAVPAAPPVFVSLYNRESESTEERDAPILQPDERAYYNGQLVTFAFFAYGQPTQFAISGLPRGAAMNAQGVVEYRPSSLPPGRHRVTVSATNAQGTTTASFTWIVHPRLRTLTVDRTQYQVGDTLQFTAEFNAPVLVLGAPFVPVRSGTRQARYVSGSGTQTLTFAYVTQEADGAFREYTPQSLQLGDGEILSLDGVSATLRALWLGKVNPPEYVVSAPAAGYQISEFRGDSGPRRRLSFDVTYPREIVVAGQPALRLTVAGQTRLALLSAKRWNGLSFAYDAQPGEHGPVTVHGRIELNGGSINAADGANMGLDFTPPPAGAITLDAVAPEPVAFTELTAGAQPFLSGTAEPLARVVLWFTAPSGAKAIYTPDVRAGADGRWQAQMTPTLGATYSVTAYALDLAGNQSATTTFTFTAGNAWTSAPQQPPPPTGGAHHTIAFVSPVSRIAVGEPVLLHATSSAGLPISYSVLLGDAAFDGSILIPRRVAPLVVRASSPGNGVYAPAYSDISFGTPERGAQDLLPAPSSGRVGEAVLLPEVSSAGLPVTYTLRTGRARLQGRAVTGDEAGLITLAATQAGNEDYLPAMPEVFTLTILAGGQPSRLSNLSARVRVSAGDRSGSSIIGFVISGNESRQVLVRAVGPSLATHGVAQPLRQPALRLLDGAGRQVAANSGWSDDGLIGATGERLGAFPLPGGSRDAATLVTLPSGAYSAQVTAPEDGVALLEVYDAAASDAGPAGRLLNLSARGRVGMGEDVLVAGFVVDGTAAKRVLIRASGPALAAYGVSDALPDPALHVYRSDTGLVARNDDWASAQPLLGQTAPATREDLEAAIRSASAFPYVGASRDAAVVVTLPPGAYSAVASGVDGQTGSALLEVYELP